MMLSEEVKKRIIDILDSDEFKLDLYNGLEEDKRKFLQMFYTPADVCIQMLEQYNIDSFAGKTILDPTCGSGNLLIAMLIAGADSDKLFGNEYDAVAVELCRKRLNRACDLLNKPRVKEWQIHRGNALQSRCLTDFSEAYEYGDEQGCHYDPAYIDDLEYAQSNNSWAKENEAANRRKVLSMLSAEKPTSTLWGNFDLG